MEVPTKTNQFTERRSNKLKDENVMMCGENEAAFSGVNSFVEPERNNVFLNTKM